MRKIVNFLIIAVMTCTCLPSIQAQQEQGKKSAHEWWKGGRWQRPKPNPQAEILPLIQVKGNKLVNSRGDTILFRGLAISDPDKLEGQGHWNKRHFEEVKKMGAMIVRIPVHPIAWRERMPEKYLELLDQAVTWCTELEMYVIIDWHSIGNLEMELFQNPMYDTGKKETFEFWLDKGKSVGEEDYGIRIIKYLEERGISWLCWVYDPEWHPRMLESWDNYNLTGCGEFFKKALHGEILRVEE